MSEAHVESRSIYIELILSSWCLDVGLEDNTDSSSIKNKLDANCNSSNMIHIGLTFNLLYFPYVPVMTQVKLSRTSRSPAEPLLAVKSTMENESRQAHENNGFIFKPFTSHQIICCIFLTFSHHHSYLPPARDH